MNRKIEPWGLHWFRRDLRITGNPALQWSWREHSGRTLGFFCFDSAFLSRPDFSPNRFAFFLDTLTALKDELRSRGSDLLVLDIGPDRAFGSLFAALSAHGIELPRAVSYNRDYEPFARERDSRVSALLNSEYGITVHSERDHLLIEPEELLKPDRGYYQIYSPFARRWFQHFGSSEVRERIASQRKALNARSENQSRPFSLDWPGLFGGSMPLEDQCERYRHDNAKNVTVPIPPAGSAAALERLRSFRNDALAAYAEQRDIPGRDGTSQLSIYLKNGTLTAAQIIAELEIDIPDFKRRDGPTVYLKELVWREFYYHILYHRPDVEQQAFLPKFRSIEWENDVRLFSAWKEGRTGFPIVDAGMRQLSSTGWMHNRVRMIVASFLTKDLHINWQWGERHFMQQLLDGDLAPNNGGWQWAASTGCDPQPYFRIFNPRLQSERFDPDGAYIREYLPELSKLSAKEIHTPHESGKKIDYPAPIVDHAERKAAALRMYSN